MAVRLYHQTGEMLVRDRIYPGYYTQNADLMETASDSDLESDDTTDYTSEYTDVDVNNIFGQAIAVWTYSKPDSLSLLTPRPDDTIFHVLKYAQDKMGFLKEKEKIMVMEARDKAPKEIRDIYTVKPGSVVMVLPKKSLHLMIEINQLKTKFPMSADITCTVYEVKAYIKRVKGIQIEQQDILYRDRALENNRRLFECKVKNNATMHVLLQVHFDILINVETFWGKTYRLYVDRCSTGSDLIYTLFGRTFSRHSHDRVMIHELYVPVHILILQHNKRSIHWDYCLGYFGIKSGDTLVLGTVGKQSNLKTQTVNVVSEIGENFAITVSEFDRWSVVAFMLHGLTDVPVDFIRLFKDRLQLDFTSVIGQVPKSTPIIMNIIMTSVDQDLMYGIPLRIGLGNGIVENMKVLPTRLIKDVKKRLEDIGVPNASLYELTVGDLKLPNDASLQHLVKDLQRPLLLKVEKFPVFIHAPDGIIYKSMMDVNHTMRDLKVKIEMKSGHAISTCQILLAGQEIKLDDDAILYENGFSTRTSVFVQYTTFSELFFITRGDLLIKLKIPLKPHAIDIKRYIWDCRDIPEGSITCLQTFFFWYFLPKVSKKYMLQKRKKNRKLIPAANRLLLQASDRKPYPAYDRNQQTDEAYNLRSKSFKYKPVVSKRPEASQSWPKVSNTHLQPIRHVESWINDNKYEPRFNRGHPTRVKRRHTLKESRKPHQLNPLHKSESLHIQPRWIGNLYNKNDEHRLDSSDEDGLGYKQRHNHNAMPFLTRKLVSEDMRYTQPRVHNQGDATTAKYFQRKMMFDRQENLYTDTEGDDQSMYMSDFRQAVR